MNISTKYNLGDEVSWHTWWIRSDSGNEYGPIRTGKIVGMRIDVKYHMYTLEVVKYMVEVDGENVEIIEPAIITQPSSIDEVLPCRVTFCRSNTDGQCDPLSGRYKTCESRNKESWCR